MYNVTKKSLIHNFWVVMRISFLTMVALMTMTGLLLAKNGASQSLDDYKVDLSFSNAPLKAVFQEIESKTDFTFSFASPIGEIYVTNLNYRNTRLDSVLESMSGRLDLKYDVIDGMVAVYRNPKTIIRRSELINRDRSIDNTEQSNTFTERAREMRVEKLIMGFRRLVMVDTLGGIVLDGESNEPLVGASIQIKEDPGKGTVTDFDGRFSFKDVQPTATLIISYIGYQTMEVPVDNKSDVTIYLKLNSALLDEVVVVGYGTQKKVNLTGAVDIIEGDLIENRSSPTVSQLLQGTSPGLSFSVGNFGFQPGANLGIQIRGMGSINGGEPYVVIDGIPGDLNRLNPEDIESISVLKDAAASAVYGARAPYGVILVTTKSGKSKELRATYSGNVSIASPQNLPSMLNSYTHARVINEAGVAGAGGQFFRDDIVDNIIAYQEGNYDLLKSRANFPSDALYFETTPNPNNTNQWGFNQFGNANRDWFDEYYGTGLIQKHDLTISGGGEKTIYYFSAGLFDQEGVLNYGTDTYDRYNIMGKITTSLSDFWDFTYQPRYSKTIREIPNMDRQGSYDLIFHQIARTMPTNAKYDGYGNIMIQSKIPWVNDAGTDVTEIAENWHTFATELRPGKGWKVNADFAFQNIDYLYQSKELTVYDHLVDQSQTPSGNTVPSNIRSTHRSNYYWTTNVYSSFDFSIKEMHNLGLMIGTQFEKTRNRELSSFRTNLLVQNVPSINTADGEIQSEENLLSYSTEGFFGRFNYNFKEKYLLEANARYDGTSRFRDGKRWGFFPSFSAGWNVHQESFWEPIGPVVNTLKLRGSWGELGNQNVDPYQDLLLIPLEGSAVNWIFDGGGSRPIGYAGTPSLISPDLTWETARTIDVGMDLSFLEGRLRTELDWFERTTYDMIGPVAAQPGVLGASVPFTNNATLRSRGWEVNVFWNHDFSNGFSYNIGFNIYDSRAVVTKYSNPTGVLSDWYEGKEQGEIWGYTAHDLYRTKEEIESYTSVVDLSDITGLAWNTGDVKYEDITGDGVVNDGSNTLNDHGDLSIIGNSTPHYQLGLNAGVSYKGFDFSIIVRGVAKRDLWFGSNANIFWGFRTGNQSSIFEGHLDYFRDQPGNEYAGLNEGEDNYNLDAYFPRPYINNGQNNKNRMTSTRYLQSGAYLRIQSVQIGYNLPAVVLGRMKISQARLYLSGENMLTFSKLPVGIDPVAVSSSWGAGKTYGPDRIMSFGIKVTY